MSQSEITEISAISDLSDELTIGDISKLQIVIQIPDGIYKEVKNGTQFLHAIKFWKRNNPFIFYQALLDARPDLVAMACDIPWLCSTCEGEYQEEELSIKTLINLLKTEIPKDKWTQIYIGLSQETEENVGYEITLNKMLEKGFIKKDLITLILVLKSIKRLDVIEKLKAYQKVFAEMEDEEFESKFKREIKAQVKEMIEWELKVKQFMKSQYSKVKQIIGSDETVSLSHVYIDLTILKQKPRAINMKDETTYNEIAYLRKIANKQVKIEPVNFTEELTSYEPKEPEIWCLIWNPGCGKTFLAKRTALRFNSNELVGILYSISIPCRNPDWHAMESTRYEADKKVESEYIQKWLCLGLPVGSNSSNDLAKHLNQTDGEGLLLIIDGLDEYTKKVPFKDTLLCSLLTRQSLIRATIILTSRPGAWTDISSSHELKIDRYYQVLGFSPENRDLYFKKQITNVTKLKECCSLLERHDEMAQLSLIPVNVSLFAALLKGEDSTSIDSLTKLYDELTLYLIRRELTRMSLEEFSRVTRISNFHTDILECLKRIGFIAFFGVANRDLASEENVPLYLGQEEYASHCLGLAHEHYKKESVGLITKVWTFAHLTMQEFTASLWLSNTPWTEQCLSIRYISHSNSNFSLFRMLVRFLCGLLTNRSAAVLTIMYRHLIPQPIQLIGIPISYQLEYTGSYHIQGWRIFSEMYLQLTAVLYETTSPKIPIWYDHLKQFLPTPIYLYIRTAVSPNEWICFMQSLDLVPHIQLIYINTEYFNANQFKSLIQKMKVCSISLLALSFYEKDSATVLSYTDLIIVTELKVNTKISIQLIDCDFSDVTAVNLFYPTNNQILSCMSLWDNEYSEKVLQQLTNQLSAIQNLYVRGSELSSDTLVSALCQATQLKVLHLYDIPTEYHQLLIAMLPQFSQLQEIGFNDYSLLPPISKLTNLTYLEIQDYNTKDTTLSVYLLQLINGNRHTLRGMELYYLQRIGLNCWNEFLNCLELCTNLVQLQLWDTSLPTDDVTHWCSAVNKLKLLVELEFFDVTLYDTGLMSLCQGLVYHPAIRRITLFNCMNSSLSCDALTHLIPTVSHLERLTVTDLSEPDGDPILLLKETADEHSIEHDLD